MDIKEFHKIFYISCISKEKYLSLGMEKCPSGGMVDTPVLEAGVERRAGSSPAGGTILII